MGTGRYASYESIDQVVIVAKRLVFARVDCLRSQEHAQVRVVVVAITAPSAPGQSHGRALEYSLKTVCHHFWTGAAGVVNALRYCSQIIHNELNELPVGALHDSRRLLIFVQGFRPDESKWVRSERAKTQKSSHTRHMANHDVFLACKLGFQKLQHPTREPVHGFKKELSFRQKEPIEDRSQHPYFVRDVDYPRVPVSLTDEVTNRGLDDKVPGFLSFQCDQVYLLRGSGDFFNKQASDLAYRSTFRLKLPDLLKPSEVAIRIDGPTPTRCLCGEKNAPTTVVVDAAPGDATFRL